MTQTWLILDVSYLCYRSAFALGGLKTEGVATGALFGFFRDIRDLQELFAADRFIFTFDYGYTYRLDILPTYKISRREPKEPRTQEEEMARTELRQQIADLRDKHLYALGYRNVLSQRGYEADDMIAAACHNLPPDTDAIIVSSDADLYQLLDGHVSMYSPSSKKLITRASFGREYGIDPVMWPFVKALAGCSTDDIPGVAGIGETYAARYYAGKLKPTSKAYAKIVAGIGVVNTNIKLTKLPAPGVEKPQWRDDDATPERWAAVTKQLGFRSLQDVRNVGVR